MNDDDSNCNCDCHKPEPLGWNSVRCCPDCGATLGLDDRTFD